MMELPVVNLVKLILRIHYIKSLETKKSGHTMRLGVFMREEITLLIKFLLNV